MGNKDLPLHWFALMAALWSVLFSPAKALADLCDPMMEVTACAYQLLQKGQHGDAAIFFERALDQEQSPKRRLQIALDLAHLYNNLGAYAKAAQTFQLAYALQPETQTLRALGFALIAAGDVQAARVAFEKAIKTSPTDSFLHRQLGYLCRQLHDRACAIEQFKAAIDHEENPGTTELLRREVRALSQTLWGSASLLWRTNATPGQELRFGDRVLSQSQGILEGNARIPLDLGSPDRWIAGFSRILWTIDGAAPTPQDESLQGGVGLKLKPFASQSIIIGVERLISLGAFSRDDWLFRASASKGAGFERPIGQKGKSWLFWSIYGDIAAIGLSKTDLQLSGEARLGRAAEFGPIQITPHLVLSGLWQDDALGRSSLLEGGPGLTISLPIGAGVYKAPMQKIDLTVQYRNNIAGTSRNPNGVTVTLSLSF